MRNVLIAIGLLFTSASALAIDDGINPMTNFNYNYADVRIGFDDDMTFGGKYSRLIHPNAHVVLSVDSKLESDFFASAGVGFNAPLNNWSDITGHMLVDLYKTRDQDMDNAIDANIGVLQWLSPQVYLGGTLGTRGIKDTGSGSEMYLSALGRFNATEAFGLGLEFLYEGFYGSQLIFSASFKLFDQRTFSDPGDEM